MYNLIISGGSITHGGWHTWKDFVQERYAIKAKNLAVKGQSNETIAMRAILEAEKTENPFIAIMFTSVDKWDWYVQDKQTLLELQNEKHPPLKIHNRDERGFWCTGSWFPLQKQYYKENYYSLDYQIIKTCMTIHHTKSYLTSRNIPHIILYDSPIFEYTEQEINTKPSINERKSIVTETTKPFIDLIKDYDRGLIGYCAEHNFEWFHPVYKGHPGSLAHYQYSCSNIFPELDKYFKVKQSDLYELALKMNKLWNL